MQMMQMQYFKGSWGKGGGKGWSSGGGLSSFPAEKKVWIGGLPEGLTFRELQAHFPGSKFATVMKGKGAGTGGVAFRHPKKLQMQLQLSMARNLQGPGSKSMCGQRSHRPHQNPWRRAEQIHRK